jgi:hypothetical protein
VLALPLDRRLATLTSRLGAVILMLNAAPYDRASRAAGLAEQIGVYCREAASVRMRALSADGGGRD